MFVNKFSLQKVTHNGFSWRICWGRDFWGPSSIFVQEKSRSFVESCWGWWKCFNHPLVKLDSEFFPRLIRNSVHIGVAAAHISVKEMIPNVFFSNFGVGAGDPYGIGSASFGTFWPLLWWLDDFHICLEVSTFRWFIQGTSFQEFRGGRKAFLPNSGYL